MWSVLENHVLPHPSNSIQVLNTTPRRGRTRLTIGFSSKKATQNSNHAHGLLQGGRLVRRDRCFRDMRVKRFPLEFFEEHRAGNIRDFASEFGQMKDAPSDDHIDGQTGFDAVSSAQLTFFDLATACEGSVIDLDTPAQTVPVNLLDGARSAVDIASG